MISGNSIIRRLWTGTGSILGRNSFIDVLFRRSASISTLQEERDQLEESLDLLTKENEKFQASLSEAFKQVGRNAYLYRNQVS